MVKGDKGKVVVELKEKGVSLEDCIKQLKGKVSSIYIRKVYAK